MKKTVLTAEESARLIELGVDENLASIKFDFDSNGNEIKELRFRLEYLLSILPKKITDRRNIYELRMGITDCIGADEQWFVEYKDSRTDIDELESFVSAEELIDAIYQEICWLKTGKVKEL